MRFSSLFAVRPSFLLLAGSALALIAAGSHFVQAQGNAKVAAELKAEKEAPVPKYAGDGAAVPSDAELKAKLTPEQYAVVRENATERPGYGNKYWLHHEEGIYVDIITGKPLFSSKDKFDTDCGWPGFAKPISDKEVKELSDSTHGMQRIEVRSAKGDAHLGHVFNDGPKEKGGLRYCINSAALRFVPKEKMAEAGYGDYLKIFEEKQDTKAQPVQEAKK